MSTIKTDNITWRAGEAAANSQYTVTADKVVWGTAKVWLNGSIASSTVRASFNISSTTFNGTGDATSNFTSALIDKNYSVTYGGDSGSIWFVNNFGYATYNLTTSLRVYTYGTSVPVNSTSYQFTINR